MATSVLERELIRDVRYSVRLLRRQPGFAAVAILTMALGIGATTVLFSIAYGVLLKPLPWPDPDSLVRITETRQGRTGRVPGTVSNGTFLVWRDHSVMTMEDRMAASLTKPRLSALVLSWFGVFALLVAGVGLFGVLSFSVAQRTREIGLRSALGAQRRDIVALVLRQAVWIVGWGIFVGFTAALAGVPSLSTFLYGIRPHDAVTFGAVAVVIVAVATIACLVPARRAARVDPLTALRPGR